MVDGGVYPATMLEACDVDLISETWLSSVATKRPQCMKIGIGSLAPGA